MRFLFALAALLVSFSASAFDESVTISWNDPGTEDSFKVQRSDGACAQVNFNGWTTVASPAADVLSYVDTVSDDANYCYQVAGVKDGNTGPWSAGFDISVPASLGVITVSAVLN
jgi:hypothetical protein